MTDSRPQELPAPKSHVEVIDLWADKDGERALINFAAQTGIPYGLVRTQRSRRKIAPDYFDRIVKAASRRREPQFRHVTLELLHKLKPRDKRAARKRRNGHATA